MKIYNSMTGKLEEFKPIHEGQVSMYVCGPTVYDHPHIGNARPLVVFDMVKRALTEMGYQVKFVSNYTDIDDKIIKKALEEGVDSSVISERNIEAYEKLRRDLNNDPEITTVKVTDTMDAIINYIAELIELGFAYEIDGDVYFRVHKVEDYGRLSGQKKEDLLVGARIDENSKKESPLDFTLWKETTEGVKFESPWSLGRPGWHTECVVMIHNTFEMDEIDIHGGGMDLKFPHHENEVAQSCATDHNNLANYWMHNGMISFDGNKMSKSFGNVVLAKDLVEKYGVNVVRWFLLSTHYRGPLKYNDEMLEQAEKEVSRVINTLNQASHRVQLDINHWEDNVNHDEFREFLDAMADDFNTPNGYKVIFDSVKKINTELRQRDLNYQEIIKSTNALLKMIRTLGLRYELPKVLQEDIDLYNNWNSAKQDKDFELADKYRDVLMKKGLI